jgi:hypothetical protein
LAGDATGRCRCPTVASLLTHTCICIATRVYTICSVYRVYVYTIHIYVYNRDCLIETAFKITDSHSAAQSSLNTHSYSTGRTSLCDLLLCHNTHHTTIAALATAAAASAAASAATASAAAAATSCQRVRRRRRRARRASSCCALTWTRAYQSATGLRQSTWRFRQLTLRRWLTSEYLCSSWHTTRI